MDAPDHACSCFGAVAGREPCEAAWDAQAALEQAMNGDEEQTVALLDYYKFFDSFHPPFFAALMKDMVVDSGLIDLFQDLNTNATRRVRIAGTYGHGFQTFNALGQGDTLTLLIALTYVSIQFSALDKYVPSVKGSAVVDDRTLRGPGVEVDAAVRFIMSFDQKAGHVTHPGKLAYASALWFGAQPEVMVAATGTNGKTSVATFTR